jgi:hypothetical protein
MRSKRDSIAIRPLHRAGDSAAQGARLVGSRRSRLVRKMRRLLCILLQHNLRQGYCYDYRRYRTRR